MYVVKSICLLIPLCTVVINALGVNDIVPAAAASENVIEAKGENENKTPRFMDLDGIISSAINGMNFQVNTQHSVNQASSSSSFVKKTTTQSHGTLGGQTVVKTEITEISGNNPGFRFKRDLLDDVVYKVENKAGLVKNKLAGAMADGVNLAHSGMNKVKNVLHQRLRN